MVLRAAQRLPHGVPLQPPAQPTLASSERDATTRSERAAAVWGYVGRRAQGAVAVGRAGVGGGYKNRKRLNT